MRCKICNEPAREVFSAVILSKYKIKYYFCDYCGFLHTEDPYWLDEAYVNPINITDTGLLQRNIALSLRITPILYYLFNKDGAFLDYAGGTGIFTRLMRDIGFNFYWSDPSAENVFARGFEYPGNCPIKLITCLEVFEHFVNPVSEIKKLLLISKNILFTTNLLPEKIPSPYEWWYYGIEHGQHISFYSKKTLLYLSSKFNLNLISQNNLHIFTEKKLNSFLSLIIFGKKKFLFEKQALKFLLKRAKKKMKSKTVEDMKYLISRTINYENIL